jgi:hypothetical protein
MHFKTDDKNIRVLATTGYSGCHGTAHMSTNAGTSILADMQSKLVAAEDVLVMDLTHHNITPTAYAANVASNVSIMMPTTAVPSFSSTCSYCWAHDITINMQNNITTCRKKRQAHQDDATEGNKWGGPNNIYGGPRI